MLANTIVGFVTERGARSLLDIGAGSGGVAVPVARSVERYVAVEQDPIAAQALRDAGLDVVEATFPVEIRDRFDLVVSSHSIPEGGVELYEPFLSRAWERVAPGGLLLVITFKGSNDSPLFRLSERVLRRTYAVDPRYTAMLEILAGYGDVRIAKTRSHAETTEFSDIAALYGPWFWRSDDEAVRNEPLVRAALDDGFTVGGTYRFPSEHHVIAVAKG